MYQYEYPRPALTVDAVVFGIDHGTLNLLLVRRGHPPFHGMWALPGGYVDMNETVERAVVRELEEETHLENAKLEQLATFSGVDRDPRERVVTVAFVGLVTSTNLDIAPGSDADAVRWFPVKRLPELAFDHRCIVARGLLRLREGMTHDPLGSRLLPERFTLGGLQRIYEVVLERRFDKRNFRKRMQRLGLVATERDAASPRRARTYRFDRQ